MNNNIPAHLRPPLNGRWTARFKASIVHHVLNGGMTAREACEYYGLSPEELQGWVTKFKAFGKDGLRATRAQIYGRPNQRGVIEE